MSLRWLSAAVIGAIAQISSFAASGADLSPRTYSRAPDPAVVVYDWTGFYVGGNIGYSWGRSEDTSILTNGAGTVLFTSTDKSDLNGFVGGGQAGYNWQNQNWVWGFEDDIQGTAEKGTRGFICPSPGPCTPAGGALALGGTFFLPGPAVPASLSQQINWFGTVRARGGILVAPQVLLYGTGGLAFGEINTSGTIGAAPVGFSNTATNVGWTVGVGIEGVIGGNWTAKLEYLYVDLGRVSGSFLTAIPATGVGFITSTYSSHITDNVLRVGVNYKFGGSPVVAKY